MYYICKFSDSYSVYNANTGTSRPLEAAEVVALDNLFPDLLKDNTKILSAFQITAIAPNKLAQLPMPQMPGAFKKVA